MLKAYLSLPAKHDCSEGETFDASLDTARARMAFRDRKPTSENPVAAEARDRAPARS